MAANPELQKLIPLLDGLLQDTSIPRNVRTNISLAKERLEKEEDIATAVSGAIYALDEISNDINLPMHGRTMVWNLLSELEALKER
ncbi:MAG: UPF0147 family protein [Candidatus Norongarragalinales archaeon]